MALSRTKRRVGSRIIDLLIYYLRDHHLGGMQHMDVTAIYKIAGIGIVIAILNLFLAQAGRQEQAQMLSLAGVVIVLLWLVQMIAKLFSDVESVFRWW